MTDWGRVTDTAGGAAAFFEASQVTISVNTEPLKPAMVLPYLVRTVAFNNSDWTAYMGITG